MPIDDEIKKGEKALKQLNEIKEEMNKNPLDITGNIKDRMKEIEEQLRKLKTVSTENIDEVKKLTEEFKDLAKTKESLEGLEKAIRGIGAALGVALPQLKALEIVMFIAQTVFEWSENSAKVNKQMYEIGANLGHMGEMAGIATGKVNSLAWQFGVTTEAVRDAEIGITKIGTRMEDVGEITKNQLALSKLWSEYTPQEQTRIMSVYMKEFGMSGKDAQNVMIGIVNLANSLKEVMPELDIKVFASQVQDVAVSMRKYGLETSDAIALTGTLTKLGIDQARIPELAKSLGGAFKESADKSYFAMETYINHLNKLEAELTKLRNKGAEVTPAEKERIKILEAEEAAREKLITQWNRASTIERTALINTLKDGEALKASFITIDEILKKLPGVGTLGTISSAGLMGAQKLAPDLMNMGDIAAAQAFIEARDKLLAPMEPLKVGATATEKEAYEERAKVQEIYLKAESAEKGSGFTAILDSVLKEVNTKDLKSVAEKQADLAEQVAKDTTKSRESIDIIKGILGDWYRYATGAAGQEATLRRMARTGETIKDVEEGIEMGLTEESSKKLLGIQERSKSQSKLSPAEVEAKRQSEMASEVLAWWKPNRFKIPLQEKVETEKLEDIYAQKLREREEAKEKEAEASKPALPYSGFFPQYESPQEPTGHITIGFDDTTGKLTAGYEAIKRKN